MLSNVENLRVFLQKQSGDTVENPFLEQLLAGVDRAVKSYCNQEIEQQTYTEFYTGSGTRQMVLRQKPVTSITSLYLDSTGYYGENPAGAFASTTLLVQGTDYALAIDGTLPGTTTNASRSAIVYRIGTVWPEIDRKYFPGALTLDVGPAAGNIKVVYVAGFPTIPGDVVLATHMLAAKIRRIAPIGENASENLKDYSYSLAAQAIGAPDMGSIRQLLSKYRDRAW